VEDKVHRFVLAGRHQERPHFKILPRCIQECALPADGASQEVTQMDTLARALRCDGLRDVCIAHIQSDVSKSVWVALFQRARGPRRREPFCRPVPPGTTREKYSFFSTPSTRSSRTTTRSPILNSLRLRSPTMRRVFSW